MMFPDGNNKKAESSKAAQAEVVQQKERRQSLLDAQKKTVWAQFLDDDELLLKCGLVTKKRGWSNHKRQLVLTDRPRLFYVDPSSMQVKGEVPWGPSIDVQQKSQKAFNVIVPGRVYKFFDMSSTADGWVEVLRNAMTKDKL